MPVETFKNPEAYRKWSAYRHIHGIAAPELKEVKFKSGGGHEVVHGKPKGRSKPTGGKKSGK